jgi:hypothetical protein
MMMTMRMGRKREMISQSKLKEIILSFLSQARKFLSKASKARSLEQIFKSFSGEYMKEGEPKWTTPEGLGIGELPGTIENGFKYVWAVYIEDGVSTDSEGWSYGRTVSVENSGYSSTFTTWRHNVRRRLWRGTCVGPATDIDEFVGLQDLSKYYNKGFSQNGEY